MTSVHLADDCGSTEDTVLPPELKMFAFLRDRYETKIFDLMQYCSN